MDDCQTSKLRNRIYTKWRATPVAETAIKMVGSNESRNAAKTVTTNPIKVAGSFETNTGAIIESMTQPAVLSKTILVLGDSSRLRNYRKSTIRVR